MSYHADRAFIYLCMKAVFSQNIFLIECPLVLKISDMHCTFTKRRKQMKCGCIELYILCTRYCRQHAFM